MNDAPLSGMRLGLFGKGGAGKSTVTVLLARSLAHMGYRPVVLDADSTNIGITRALGAGDGPQTLIDHFGGLVFSGGAVTCPVDDPTPLAGAELDLDRLPTRFLGHTPLGIRVLVGGKMGDLGPGAGCDGPIAKVARDVRVRSDDDNPLLLVDFKAGFEDSARGVLTGLDWAVVVCGIELPTALGGYFGSISARPAYTRAMKTNFPPEALAALGAGRTGGVAT